VPAFISSGHWRDHVAAGRTLVPVPIGGNTIGMRWASDAGLGFAVPQGYFLGPSGPHDPTGRYFAPARPTQEILEAVAAGETPPIGAAERERAHEDARFWRADAVVLAPGQGHGDELRAALDDLFGAGRRIDDVWVWDV
jgi:hypothetical protein